MEQGHTHGATDPASIPGRSAAVGGRPGAQQRLVAVEQAQVQGG